MTTWTLWNRISIVNLRTCAAHSSNDHGLMFAPFWGRYLCREEWYKEFSTFFLACHLRFAGRRRSAELNEINPRYSRSRCRRMYTIRLITQLWQMSGTVVAFPWKNHGTNVTISASATGARQFGYLALIQGSQFRDSCEKKVSSMILFYFSQTYPGHLSNKHLNPIIVYKKVTCLNFQVEKLNYKIVLFSFSLFLLLDFFFLSFEEIRKDNDEILKELKHFI